MKRIALVTLLVILSSGLALAPVRAEPAAIAGGAFLGVGSISLTINGSWPIVPDWGLEAAGGLGADKLFGGLDFAAQKPAEWLAGLAGAKLAPGLGEFLGHVHGGFGAIVDDWSFNADNFHFGLYGRVEVVTLSF